VLALSAGFPNQDWHAVTIGKASSSSGYERSTLGPVAPDEARRLLDELVDLRDRGVREPLPMAVKTAARYASLRDRNRPTEVAATLAARDWTDGRFPGEQSDREHEIVWGDDPPLDVLLAEPPRPDEVVWRDEVGWTDEQTRFGVLARRLWAPLLAHEAWADE
jgi:exodeoxyribonuclease V gamma subunit